MALRKVRSGASSDAHPTRHCQLPENTNTSIEKKVDLAHVALPCSRRTVVNDDRSATMSMGAFVFVLVNGIWRGKLVSEPVKIRIRRIFALVKTESNDNEEIDDDLRTCLGLP